MLIMLVENNKDELVLLPGVIHTVILCPLLIQKRQSLYLFRIIPIILRGMKILCKLLSSRKA